MRVTRLDFAEASCLLGDAEHSIEGEWSDAKTNRLGHVAFSSNSHTMILMSLNDQSIFAFHMVCQWQKCSTARSRSEACKVQAVASYFGVYSTLPERKCGVLWCSLILLAWCGDKQRLVEGFLLLCEVS